MTELEKLTAGLPYHFMDAEVVARKENAVVCCNAFNKADPCDYKTQLEALDKLLGSHGPNLSMQHGFQCDNGKNIHVGEGFLTNYNVTILDIAPVHIGDYCMIGPNALITTVGHPLQAKGRGNALVFVSQYLLAMMCGLAGMLPFCQGYLSAVMLSLRQGRLWYMIYRITALWVVFRHGK